MSYGKGFNWLANCEVSVVGGGGVAPPSIFAHVWGGTVQEETHPKPSTV